jgi:peptidoglycan/LPS O-acetylase OafA/YrhL
MVFLFHAVGILINGDMAQLGLTHPLAVATSWMWMGVDVFFALSGALMVSSLLKGNSVTDSAKKRVLRIYPAYLFTFLLLGYSIFPERGDLAYFFAFPNIYLSANGLSSTQELTHFWSIGTEILYYGAIALLFTLGRKWFGSLIGAIALFFPVLLGVHALVGPMTIMGAYASPLTHGFPFWVAAAASIDKVGGGLSPFASKWLALVGKLSLLILPVSLAIYVGIIYYTRMQGNTIEDLGIGYLILFMAILVNLSYATYPLIQKMWDKLPTVSSPKSAVGRHMTRMGESSYSFYLAHPFVLMAFYKQEVSLAAGLILSYLTTYLISRVMYRFVEQPFIRIARNQYRKSDVISS